MLNKIPKADTPALIQVCPSYFRSSMNPTVKGKIKFSRRPIVTPRRAFNAAFVISPLVVLRSVPLTQAT